LWRRRRRGKGRIVACKCGDVGDIGGVVQGVKTLAKS